MPAVEKLSWKTEKRVVDSLIPWEKNPRQASEDEIASIKKSLDEFNLVEIPVMNLDGRILAGHQRLNLMKLAGRGQEEIDVRIPNRMLTEDEATRYALISNRVHASWDWDKLGKFEMPLLKDVGFDPKELDALMAKGKEEAAPSTYRIMVEGHSDKALERVEKDGKHFLMVELDPVYIDGVIGRWQKLTAKKGPQA